MLSLLKKLPHVDETWSCHGHHPGGGRKSALLIWRCGRAPLASAVVTAPDPDAHARALERLVESGVVQALPARLQVEDPTVARLLARLLIPHGVAVVPFPGLPPADVDAFASDFVLRDVARAAVPRWTSPEATDRLREALHSLRLDEAWLHLPINLGLLVEGVDASPFGLLVHADCCPGFTVLPLDGRLRATIRRGTTTIRLQRADPLGVFGRWPKIVEDTTAGHSVNPFHMPQRRLSVTAVERLEASVEIVLGIASATPHLPTTLTLRRSVQCPINARLSPWDLGVVSAVLPFPGGDQHVRLRAA